MTAVLRLDAVSAGYGARDVLHEVTIEVARGEVAALVGPNGAGKSTALRVAAGLLGPSTGSISLEGQALGAWKARDLARTMALVPQSPTTPPYYTVKALVSLGRTPHIPFLGSESTRDRHGVWQAMERAGVTEFADRHVDELSGGERQRVAIARALAQEPRLLLLDEPTNNLDLHHQDAILSLLRRLAGEEGLACMVVLHDLSLVGQFADSAHLIADGRLVASGPPDGVLDESRLSGVYGTPLRVIAHPESGASVVVHAARKR